MTNYRVSAPHSFYSLVNISNPFANIEIKRENKILQVADKMVEDICKEQITVFREAALFANARAECPN